MECLVLFYAKTLTRNVLIGSFHSWASMGEDPVLAAMILRSLSEAFSSSPRERPKGRTMKPVLGETGLVYKKGWSSNTTRRSDPEKREFICTQAPLSPIVVAFPTQLIVPMHSWKHGDDIVRCALPLSVARKHPPLTRGRSVHEKNTRQDHLLSLLRISCEAGCKSPAYALL
jgi:hypothetical protein